MDFSALFKDKELLPVIVQHESTGQVLMQGYANAEALSKTAESGTGWFYSRSRARLWQKGETSGHYLRVRRILADCDYDSLLYICLPEGPTCHTGAVSCFHNQLWDNPLWEERSLLWKEKNLSDISASEEPYPAPDTDRALNDLYNIILERRENPGEGSYTAYLFRAGLDKILKKLAEETGETIIAAKNRDLNELTEESCDLLYHLLTLLCYMDLPLSEIALRLKERSAKTHNLKPVYKTDKNS